MNLANGSCTIKSWRKPENSTKLQLTTSESFIGRCKICRVSSINVEQNFTAKILCPFQAHTANHIFRGHDGEKVSIGSLQYFKSQPEIVTQTVSFGFYFTQNCVHIKQPLLHLNAAFKFVSALLHDTFCFFILFKFFVFCLFPNIHYLQVTQLLRFFAVYSKLKTKHKTDREVQTTYEDHLPCRNRVNSGQTVYQNPLCNMK